MRRLSPLASHLGVALLTCGATLLAAWRLTRADTRPPRPVSLRLAAPAAHAVFVAGTFNDWRLTEHRMRRDSAGVWRATLALAPGRYEYKFIVDGEWAEDPANPLRVPVPAPGSGHNSVLEVAAPPP